VNDTEAKATFIELRAKGASYDSIAKQLNKSKSTLVTWNQELNNEIQNAEFLEYQVLLEQFKLTKKAKIEYLGEQLNKAREVLKTKDLNEIPIKDLIILIEKYEKNLKDELLSIQYHTGKFINRSFDTILELPTEIIEKLVQE
jgi:transposase